MKTKYFNYGGLLFEAEKETKGTKAIITIRTSKTSLILLGEELKELRKAIEFALEE